MKRLLSLSPQIHPTHARGDEPGSVSPSGRMLWVTVDTPVQPFLLGSSALADRLLRASGIGLAEQRMPTRDLWELWHLESLRMEEKTHQEDALAALGRKE